MILRINAIVKKRVRKYTLASLDPDDLMQEGRLAAAYAVDTYTAGRGNLDGYISTVVNNALAMVAAEALAQSRQPYKLVQELDGTQRKVPINHVEIEHETAADEQLDQLTERREHSRLMAARAALTESKLAQLGLSVDAHALLGLRLHTPPELWILARNLNRGRMKLEVVSVCLHLGWLNSFSDTPEPDRHRYQRACRELRDQFRYVLGIDDQTFEVIAAKPVPAELFMSQKQRAVRP
jgi:hypothetical protein